jgi:hypothetical protein
VIEVRKTLSEDEGPSWNNMWGGNFGQHAFVIVVNNNTPSYAAPLPTKIPRRTVSSKILSQSTYIHSRQYSPAEYMPRYPGEESGIS